MGSTQRHGHSGALPGQLVSFAKHVATTTALPTLLLGFSIRQFSIVPPSSQHPQEQPCITWSPEFLHLLHSTDPLANPDFHAIQLIFIEHGLCVKNPATVPERQS